MKYLLMTAGLVLLASCGTPKDDYCHTQNPASDVDLRDRLCDNSNDGGISRLAPESSPRPQPRPDTPDATQPTTPPTDNPPTDNPGGDGPSDPPKDKPRDNNGHGNGNDDGMCQGRGCTDETNPGNGPKNQ